MCEERGSENQFKTAVESYFDAEFNKYHTDVNNIKYILKAIQQKVVKTSILDDDEAKLFGNIITHKRDLKRVEREQLIKKKLIKRDKLLKQLENIQLEELGFKIKKESLNPLVLLQEKQKKQKMEKLKQLEAESFIKRMKQQKQEQLEKLRVLRESSEESRKQKQLIELQKMNQEKEHQMKLKIESRLQKIKLNEIRNTQREKQKQRSRIEMEQLKSIKPLYVKKEEQYFERVEIPIREEQELILKEREKYYSRSKWQKQYSQGAGRHQQKKQIITDNDVTDLKNLKRNRQRYNTYADSHQYSSDNKLIVKSPTIENVYRYNHQSPYNNTLNMPESNSIKNNKLPLKKQIYSQNATHSLDVNEYKKVIRFPRMIHKKKSSFNQCEYILKNKNKSNEEKLYELMAFSNIVQQKIEMDKQIRKYNLKIDDTLDNQYVDSIRAKLEILYKVLN